MCDALSATLHPPPRTFHPPPRTLHPPPSTHHTPPTPLPFPTPLAPTYPLQAKRFFMSIGPGHSLHITDGKTTHEFHGIGERDTCLKVILGQCANLNNKPAVIEEGK